MEQDEKKDVLLENDNNSNVNTFTQDFNISQTTPENSAINGIDNVEPSLTELEMHDSVSQIENPVMGSPFVTDTNLTDVTQSNINELPNNNFNFDNQFNMDSNNSSVEIQNNVDENNYNMQGNELNNDSQINSFDNVTNSYDVQSNNIDTSINNLDNQNINVQQPVQEFNAVNPIINETVQPIQNNNVDESDLASDEEIKKFFKDFLIIAVIVIIAIILLPYISNIFGL